MNRYVFVLIFTALSIFLGCKYNKALQKNKPVSYTPADSSKYTGGAFKEHIRPTDARTPEEERLGFKLPEGFEISLYASEPDIGKPINISFDARGRMWVTQSFEYPFAAAPGKAKDRLTILEDTDNDGKADRIVHFNDTLNIPIGILPVNDGAVAYSIPAVYKFTDANGDGKPESQKKFLGPFEFKDTHGMVNNFIRGYDGWIHACHGYSNRSVVAGADGDSIRMFSGNTFRFKPDGSHVEKTTDGRINPFGLAYDEMGYLYSTDCHTSPLYQLIRGGDYTQWGKAETMGFAPEMKPFDNEATALAGIAYYADVHFPESYKSNFYIGDPVSSRVYRNSFTFNGSTPVGKKEPDFILSEDPWFRPVDVKLGPDGALYIADFYNSIIGHYEVPLTHPKRDRIRGRIWRVTYKGKSNQPKNWTTASVNELLDALDMNNLPVRMFAGDQLADRIGQPAVAPLKGLLSSNKTSSRKYIHALWVLHRLNALDADMIKKSAAHKDALVRIHTLRILSEQTNPDMAYFPVVNNALQDANPHIQRAAAELLMKFPEMTALKAALALRNKIPGYDTHLTYTARLCLRNLLRNQELMTQASGANWGQEDAAFLADVMVDVPSKESGVYLARFMKNNAPASIKLPIAYQHIARFLPDEQLDEVIITAKQKNDNLEARYVVFKALQQGIAQKGAKESGQMVQFGKELAEGILRKYPAGSSNSQSAEAAGLVVAQQNFAIQQAGNYTITSLEPLLTAFTDEINASNSNTGDANLQKQKLELKTAALRALLKINPLKNAPLAARILQDEATPVDLRKQVATLLGEFPGPAVNAVLADVKHAPQDLQTAIVMSLANTDDGKNIIFRQVRNGKIMARTLVDAKAEERILLGITPKQKQEYDELIANLEPVRKEKEALIDTRLKQFFPSAVSATSDSGRITFTQNCATCHRIGTQGGLIGPNLDGVNKWGAQALAEKILDPNRNIAENFRTYTIRLKDGKVMTGLYRREAGAVIVFADMAGQEFSVPKNDIAERKASKYTLMPDHFGTVLSQGEFNALINYLLNLKS